MLAFGDYTFREGVSSEGRKFPGRAPPLNSGVNRASTSCLCPIGLRRSRSRIENGKLKEHVKEVFAGRVCDLQSLPGLTRHLSEHSDFACATIMLVVPRVCEPVLVRTTFAQTFMTGKSIQLIKGMDELVQLPTISSAHVSGQIDLGEDYILDRPLRVDWCAPCPAPCGCLPPRPRDEHWVLRWECSWQRTECECPIDCAHDEDDIQAPEGIHVNDKLCVHKKVWRCLFFPAPYRTAATYCNPRRVPAGADCNCPIPPDQYYKKTYKPVWRYCAPLACARRLGAEGIGNECGCCIGYNLDWVCEWEHVSLPRDCAWVADPPICAQECVEAAVTYSPSYVPVFA